MGDRMRVSATGHLRLRLRPRPQLGQAQQLDEAIVADALDLIAQQEAVIQRGQLIELGQLVAGRDYRHQRCPQSLRPIVELALVEQRQQRVQTGLQIEVGHRVDIRNGKGGR